MTIKKINNHQGKKSSLVKKMKKSIKKNNNNKINKNVNSHKLTTRRNFNTKMNKKVGGGEVNLDNDEITIFVSYLASDDRDFITKCSKHVNSDVGDDETVTKVKAVLAKIFPDQRDCEGFALNVLGKVSIFKNLYDYHQRMTDKLTKEGKESNVVNILELTPERIQRISRAMEGRCDVTSNNNIGNSLSEEDKDIVANIIDSVYSVNNMKEIIGQLSKEHLKLVDAIALQKSKNSFNSDEEIKLENDVNTMADILSISQEEDIIKNLSYDIKQIIKSYFGFNDNNNDCRESIMLIGLIKSLFAISNSKNIKQILSESTFKELVDKITYLIIHYDAIYKSLQTPVQFGGRNGRTKLGAIHHSIIKKLLNSDLLIMSLKNDYSFGLDVFATILSKPYNLISPSNLFTKIMTGVFVGATLIIPAAAAGITAGIGLHIAGAIYIGVAIITHILFRVSQFINWITSPLQRVGEKFGNWWKERKEKKKTKKEAELMKLYSEIMEKNALKKAAHYIELKPNNINNINNMNMKLN